MQSVFSFAKALAARGIPIFRIEEGTKDHFIDMNWNRGGATFDKGEVAARFFNAKCNIGVWCGGSLLVVDIDKAYGGEEAWADLCKQWGHEPITFTVRTPGGGRHLYFDRGAELFGQADLVRGKVNIRSGGGYVVGPGSTFKGKLDKSGQVVGAGRYEIALDVPIAPLPACIRDMLRAKAQEGVRQVETVSDLDTPANLARAEQHLDAAPVVDEGGRNNALYEFVARVGDFGISDEKALDFARLWNAKCCRPPLDDDELQHTTTSAFNSRTRAIGIEAPGRGLTPLLPPKGVEPPPPPLLDIRWFTQTPLSPLGMKPRQWIAERRLARGFVTGLIAPGAVGKSLISIQWAAAIATGNGTPTGLCVRERTKVLILNNEDPKEELDMRAAAIFKALKFDYAEAFERIAFLSGYGNPVRLAAKDRGRIEATPAVDFLINFIKANDIGVFIADPVISTHKGLNENDNTEMDELLSVYRRIAAETNCAILLVHHSRKPGKGSAEGYIGDVDSGRGASSIKDAMRFAFTFYTVPESDCEVWEIKPEERHRYVRLDETDKINLGLKQTAPQFFYRETVVLELGDNKTEALGVLRPADVKRRVPPSPFDTALADIVELLEVRGRMSLTDTVKSLKEREAVKGTAAKLVAELRTWIAKEERAAPGYVIEIENGPRSEVYLKLRAVGIAI